VIEAALRAPRGDASWSFRVQRPDDSGRHVNCTVFITLSVEVMRKRAG